MHVFLHLFKTNDICDNIKKKVAIIIKLLLIVFEFCSLFNFISLFLGFLKANLIGFIL